MLGKLLNFKLKSGEKNRVIIWEEGFEENMNVYNYNTKLHHRNRKSVKINLSYLLSTDNKSSETREQDKRLQDLDSGFSL